MMGREKKNKQFYWAPQYNIAFFSHLHLANYTNATLLSPAESFTALKDKM